MNLEWHLNIFFEVLVLTTAKSNWDCKPEVTIKTAKNSGNEEGVGILHVFIASNSNSGK